MPNLDDYREVPERIAEWYVRHPEGRIVCEVLTEPTSDHPWWTVKASCYRNADAILPAGVGHSFLNVPGTTNFTRGSELENAETSAAGRALVMAGIPSSRISSGFEVEMKGGGSEGSASQGRVGTGGEATVPPPSPPQPDAKLAPAAATALKDLFPTSRAALEMASRVLEMDVKSLRDITNAQAQKVVQALADERAAVHAADGGGYGD